MDRDDLSTAEAVVLDGANGVTRAPREHFQGAWFSLALAVIAAVVARFVFTRAPRWVLPVMLALAAIPGLVQVLVWRADAPVKRVSMARVVRNTLSEMQRLAPWPGATAGKEDDDVLFPLSRYAIPGRKPTRAMSGVVLETKGPKLGEGCRVTGFRVTCGAGS